MKTQVTDVIIAGGGLAGLSLAKQLHMANAALDITVIERRTFPIPHTTANVGESTVEIGAYYFGEKLGLKKHFQDRHLLKYGIRCFFGSHQVEFAQQDELGFSELFGISTYQIERGVLENHLYHELIAAGVHIVDSATTEHVALGNKDQRMVVQRHRHGDDPSMIERLCFQSPWLVDATGRQGLLKHKLGLEKPSPHRGNAVWFRIDKRILIDDWSTQTAWQQRLKRPGNRWRSTNHLMGVGYWVWVIPLASGATSIGIVMDDQALAESGIEDFATTCAWLQREQPRCAQAIASADLLDFNMAKNYSYACEKMFSDEGWCLTGEAGAFVDPFYSPGSDFIAINNTLITHLITKDKIGQDIRLDSLVFHRFYDTFFESSLSLYTHQYGGFGDRHMMSAKVAWDYVYYWGVLAVLFFTNAIVDIGLIRRLSPLLQQAQASNKVMQGLFVERAKKRLVLPAKGLFIDQKMVPCFQHLTTILKKGEDIDAECAITESVALLEQLQVYISSMLVDEPSMDVSSEEKSVLGDYRLRVLA